MFQTKMSLRFSFLLKKYFCTIRTKPSTSKLFSENIIVHDRNLWPKEIYDKIRTDFEIADDFINENEEKTFVAETAVPLKRLRYEKDHWDHAIKLYREIEKQDWNPECTSVINKIRQFAFPKDTRHLGHVHVLDLSKDGLIKPHIDSVRYCGETIAGLSLLSDCIMRLAHKDNKLLKLDLLLKRRSLYVLRGIGRKEFTHEVLGSEESYFGNTFVPRDRRISVICRSLPNPEDID